MNLDKKQKNREDYLSLEKKFNNLNNHYETLKKKHTELKNENSALKASNDNHIFINEKLNKAIQKLKSKQGDKGKNDSS